MPEVKALVEVARREIAVSLAVTGRRLTLAEIDTLDRLLDKHIRLARRAQRIDPRPTPADGLPMFSDDEETTPRGRLPQGVRTQRK